MISICRTRSSWTRKEACSSVIERTSGFNGSMRKGKRWVSGLASRRMAWRSMATATSLWRTPSHQVLRLDAEGKVVQRIGQKGQAPGEFELPHMLTFDTAGNLFVAEVEGKRFQKFKKK